MLNRKHSPLIKPVNAEIKDIINKNSHNTMKSLQLKNKLKSIQEKKQLK